MKIKFQCAVLFVRDIEQSKKFYHELLGLPIEADFGVNVGLGGLALWQADYVRGLLGNAAAEGERLGAGNLEVYLESADIAEAVSALSSAGVRFLHPLVEQPWAQRVVRFYDPDGHIVEIGEPMDCVVRRLLGDGLSPEEVSKRTMMPIEFIDTVK